MTTTQIDTVDHFAKQDSSPALFMDSPDPALGQTNENQPEQTPFIANQDTIPDQ